MKLFHQALYCLLFIFIISAQDDNNKNRDRTNYDFKDQKYSNKYFDKDENADLLKVDISQKRIPDKKENNNIPQIKSLEKTNSMNNFIENEYLILENIYNQKIQENNQKQKTKIIYNASIEKQNLINTYSSTSNTVQYQSEQFSNTKMHQDNRVLEIQNKLNPRIIQTSTQLNGFINSHQTSVQLQSKDTIDSFYYSDQLEASLVLTHSEDFIYFNTNQSDISLREQLLINFSKRDDDKKYVRKFYYSETLSYVLILLDNQQYSILDSRSEFFSNISGLSSVIEVYTITINDKQIASMKLVQSINNQSSTSKFPPIVDFDVVSDDTKFVIVTDTIIQMYESNLKGNNEFVATQSFVNTGTPYSKGFSNLSFSQNLILLFNSLIGLSAYRTDTSIWYAGEISFTGSLFQSIYLGKIFFIFKDLNIYQGSLTFFQLATQNKPNKKSLEADNIQLFTKAPQSVKISQNFLFVQTQSDVIAIYQINESTQKSNQYEFQLLQTLRTQQNIIQIQMTTLSLIILNFKQLTTFIRLNETLPKQLDYISLFPSQRRWYTSTTGYVPPLSCAYYDKYVYIVTQNNLVINSEDSTQTTKITLASTINRFGIIATPSSYYILYSTLNLLVFSLDTTKNTDNTSTLALNKQFSVVEQIQQTFPNCIFIRGQIIQQNPTDPIFYTLSIYNLANNFVFTQINLPSILKTIQCDYFKYSIITNKVYLISGKKVYEITSKFEVTLFYDFSNIIEGEQYKGKRIFISQENAYIIFNLNINIYEINMQTKSVKIIAIPFKMIRLYPLGNLLILTNESQIAIFEKFSNNILLFKPMNENNNDQIICQDSYQSIMRRFSFVQNNKVIEYQFQRYQQNVVVKLMNTNIPISLGSKLEFEYYISDLNDQTLKLSQIQQDMGLDQQILNYNVGSLGHTYIDSSNIYLKEIGINTLLNSKRENEGIESCLILFTFLQKLTNLSKDTLEALLTVNQITSDGYIISERLQTSLNTLSISESEKEKIRNSIISIHFPVQLKESLVFDENKLLSFSTPSSKVWISLTFQNKYFEFVLKNVFVAEISESVDWYISNDKSTMVVQGDPDKIKQFTMYFMIKKISQDKSYQDETIVVGFKDFLNSERSIILNFKKFKDNNNYLLQEVKGLIIENQLQKKFEEIYSSSKISQDLISFSIPQGSYVDSDIKRLDYVLLSKVPNYEEKNSLNIYYSFYYTLEDTKIDYSNISENKQGIQLLTDLSGVVISQNTINISVKNLQPRSYFSGSHEFYKIIVCAENEINRICDEFYFTIIYQNTLNLLLVILAPIGGVLILYYIYQKMYVISFFLNMEKVTFSDEKIYTNNAYHKQIPIVFDQYEIGKDLWEIYYAIRISKIEQQEGTGRYDYYDDEENGMQGRFDEQNDGRGSQENGAIIQSQNGQNNNYLSVKPPSSKKIEMQMQTTDRNNTKRSSYKSAKLKSQNSQELTQNISNIGGLTSGRQNSSNNLKGYGGDEQEVQNIGKNPTSDNSVLKLPLGNLDVKDLSFNITPVHNQNGEAIHQNIQNDQNGIQQPDKSFNMEQNSQVDVKKNSQKINNPNNSYRQDQENLNGMSFLNQSQIENTENSFMNNIAYQSYQEFIYYNKKIQITTNSYNNSALLKSPTRPDDSSASYLSYTKFQGPPLSNYQVNSLTKIIEQQKIEDDKNSFLFYKCFQQNNIKFDKTNSYIVRDLLNNSFLFNQKVFKLFQNTKNKASPEQDLHISEQPENLAEEVGTPRSNKQTYKRQQTQNNTNNSNTFFQRLKVNGQRKDLLAQSKNINKQVDEIKQKYSKLIRDQLGLKTLINKRLNNLKEEQLIDEFGCINEDILIDDIRKTMIPYLNTKIEKKINQQKYEFLLSEVKKLNIDQCPVTRYFFIEFSRHIITIDHISSHMYQYLKNLALLYNNQNDWYKTYLYIIGHDQDNQIYPFPSIIVKDDMINQATNDLNVRAVGIQSFLKEKTKIVGQALTADALDLNKFEGKCGESLQLGTDDQIETIKAINIENKIINGKMKQFTVFLSWMFGNFDKQQLLNNQQIPEWMTCGITYNTIHIKGYPNNSQVGRFLILVCGKRNKILRSFILKVCKSQEHYKYQKRRREQLQQDQISNMEASKMPGNEYAYDHDHSPYLGIKKDEIKSPYQDLSKSKQIRKSSSQNQKDSLQNSNIFSNKYQPKNKSLFQKTTNPSKQNSFIKSPPGSQQSIQSQQFKPAEKQEGNRLRVFSEYIENYQPQQQQQQQQQQILTKSRSIQFNDINQQPGNELTQSVSPNINKLKQVTEEENHYESSMKSSQVTDNRSTIHNVPQKVRDTKLLPNNKNTSVTMFEPSGNDLLGQTDVTIY